MTALKSFWVLTYQLCGDDVICGASAVMESSMLNALTRFLTKPLKFYDLIELSDVMWRAVDKIALRGHHSSIEVFFQDDEPLMLDVWRKNGGKFIVADQRSPELLETSKRESNGFKRIPTKISFGI